jgi:hypothetical protein
MEQGRAGNTEEPLSFGVMTGCRWPDNKKITDNPRRPENDLLMPPYVLLFNFTDVWNLRSVKMSLKFVSRSCHESSNNVSAQFNASASETFFHRHFLFVVRRVIAMFFHRQYRT